MRTPRTKKRAIAGILAAGLLIAACGSDDDGGDEGDTTEAPAGSDAAEEEATEETEAADEEATDDTEAMEEESTEGTEAGDEEEAAGSGEELALEGEVEIAAGTTLNLDECPDDWNPQQGVDGDEIRIGQSLPQSGQLAAFGAIGEGMSAYFDYVNDNDPIEDKDLVLVTKDDAYEAGRTVANVEEMIDTDDIFGFAHIIGTPNNLAARDITAEACVPQLFNSTGFPLWGDPANFPWTIGNILNYETETQFWCQNIVDELGEGASVSALIMNNDFGTTYQGALEQCEADGQITLSEVQLHDPAAPDVSNEMTTIIASDADVFVAGTTAAFCPQTVGSVAASEWRPLYYMSYTCNNLASFFSPVQDQAALLADDGAGVRLTNGNITCGDPTFEDSEFVQLARSVLDEYGDGVTCEDGSYSTGVLYGLMVEEVVRNASEMPGGLNRVNLMSAVWNMNFENPGLLGGVQGTDGVNDAYISEAAEVQEVVVEDGTLTFNSLSDIIDLEGETGSYEG
ncbi:ABC transporter substrate-binding protein [Ilumatobacter nonamiensis]|uniref:ABC transporter substrate-binding protein n=1 Tax=Ilumatobacter nonamiensis TaxID=467093 RepID=UPI00034C3F3B|nr:ABC transporter substrate-binding protein [Ilumatobacter nonamiensis]